MIGDGAALRSYAGLTWKTVGGPVEERAHCRATKGGAMEVGRSVVGHHRVVWLPERRPAGVGRRRWSGFVRVHVRVHVRVLALVLAILGGTGVAAAPAGAVATHRLAWTMLSPAMSPSPRALASAADDTGTGQLLLFGGAVNGTTSVDDTWQWTGTTWTQLHPVTIPASRGGAAMAFDPATNQLVLFGGASSGGVNLNDTWQWTGATWTQLHPASSPPAAFDPVLAY